MTYALHPKPSSRTSPGLTRGWAGTQPRRHFQVPGSPRIMSGASRDDVGKKPSKRLSAGPIQPPADSFQYLPSHGERTGDRAERMTA